MSIRYSDRLRRELAPSRLADLLADKRRRGEAILDLTESNPTRAGIDYPRQDILNALSSPAALRYEPHARGLAVAREAIAQYYLEHGLPVPFDGIHLTASTSEAYAFLFKLLADPWDEVLVPIPSYPLVEFIAALEHVRLAPFNLRYDDSAGWSVDFASLEAALSPRSRALIFVNPNNPTGSYLTLEDRALLARFCVENRLGLIVDEVFLDFPLRDDVTPRSALESAEGALVFVLSGLSKILALPQAKLSWIVTAGPSELVEGTLFRLDLIADTFLSVGTAVQHAAPSLFPLRTSLQRQIVERCRANTALLAGAADARGGIRLLRADGGWYAVLRVPELKNEEAFALECLENRDVYLHPGYFFDFRETGYLVFSLLTPSAVFQEGLSRVLDTLSGWRC